MKIDKKYVIIGLILLVSCALLVRSCKISDRYSTLLGEYQALKGISAENERIAKEKIADAHADIDNLVEDNRQLHLQISESVGNISNLDGDVVRLEDELATIRTEAETIPNLKEQIVNLEGQVNICKERFTLAENIIADKDEIIFNLKEQYELQIGISVNFEALYLEQKALVLKGEELRTVISRRLRVAKFGGTFKTLTLGVLGGYLAYKLIK